MFTETTSSSDGALLELQKELARYKENESTSAHYITEMEARLGKYDEDIETLRRDMSKLERELADSRERCRTMDSLVETLRAERETERKDREEWVKILEAREKRVEALEVQMKEVERDRAFLASERERLGGVVGGVEKARRSLEVEVEGAETPFMTPTTEFGGTLPRNGVNGVNGDGGDAEKERQAAAIEELQRKHAATLEELNAVNTRYQDALHDISDLYAQINEIKLQGGVTADKTGGEPNDVQAEANGDTNTVQPDAATDSTPPIRSPPTPTQRRRAGSRAAAAAVGLESPSGASARRLFFRHAASSESLHARSQLQSVSLSQELSSARSPKSSWSANEIYNQGAGSGIGEREGLGVRGLGHRPQLSLQLPSERSADDLEKEIKSLQAVSASRFSGFMSGD